MCSTSEVDFLLMHPPLSSEMSRESLERQEPLSVLHCRGHCQSVYSERRSIPAPLPLPCDAALPLVAPLCRAPTKQPTIAQSRIYKVSQNNDIELHYHKCGYMCVCVGGGGGGGGEERKEMQKERGYKNYCSIFNK